MQITLYILLALFIAWIWVDYYRLIDVFEPEKLKYIIFTFLLGCLSTQLVTLNADYILARTSFELNGSFVNDFLYCTFAIGLVEEVAKTIPFVILFLFFRKELNEPIDYLAFICISALGFSAAENVLYFDSYGPQIISARALLSSVGHMCFTAFIGYGFIRIIYFQPKNKALTLGLYIMIAALSHGFYDFWLFYEDYNSTMAWSMITLVYFLFAISAFAAIMNNALNISPFFTYKKVVDSDKVAWRLLSYYGIVFACRFLLMLILKGEKFTKQHFLDGLLYTAPVVLITCVRLSRFKLIKNRWEKLKPEFPFSFGGADSSGAVFRRIRIKGEAHNDAFICNFYQEKILLHPLSPRNSSLKTSRHAHIDEKIFLQNDEPVYVARMFYGEDRSSHDVVILKAKTTDTTLVQDKYPIVAVMLTNSTSDLNNPQITSKHFRFVEWVVIRPLEGNRS